MPGCRNYHAVPQNCWHSECLALCVVRTITLSNSVRRFVVFRHVFVSDISTAVCGFKIKNLRARD